MSALPIAPVSMAQAVQAVAGGERVDQAPPPQAAISDSSFASSSNPTSPQALVQALSNPSHLNKVEGTSVPIGRQSDPIRSSDDKTWAEAGRAPLSRFDIQAANIGFSTDSGEKEPSVLFNPGRRSETAVPLESILNNVKAAGILAPDGMVVLRYGGQAQPTSTSFEQGLTRSALSDLARSTGVRVGVLDPQTNKIIVAEPGTGRLSTLNDASGY